LLGLISEIDMYACVCMYVNVLFDVNNLRGVGVLTCIINLEM